MKRALVSVSDKTGLVEFVQGLVDCGYEIISTGGTKKALSEVNPNSADLFVVGRDLAPQVASYPNKIILDRIMDMNELTEKLKEVFGK